MKIKDYFLSKEVFEVKEITRGILKTINMPENLDKYYDSNAYLSHSNNKKSIISKLYLVFQKFNLHYKLKIIKNYNSKGSILDYGCGNGVFLKFVKNNNYQVTGFEPNKLAAKQTEVKNIKVINSLNVNKKYDIITLWHVLEHIPNPEEVLLQLKNLLHENGKIIIAIPNYASFDAAYYKQNWAAWDVPRHIYHYSKEGAIAFFIKNNFKIEKLYPLPFDSYFISIMSAKYKKNIFYLLLSPTIGLISNIKAIKTGNWSSLIYVLGK